jgi:DNA-binding MarR family transcriptional regulator
MQRYNCNVTTSRAPGQARADRLAGELADLAGGLRRVVRRRLRQDAPEPRLRDTQLELLRAVADNPGIGVAGAARLLHLVDNSVSTLVNQLVSAGLLRREADPYDRRAVRLELTPAAELRMALWRDRRARLVGSELARLEGADQTAIETALPALRRLVMRLREGEQREA